MAALTYRITLKQPVLIGKIGSGDENSARSYSYLPGSALRGMFIRRHIQQHGTIQPENAVSPGSAFFDGRFTFLNAYPLTEDGRRTLPTPRSWRTEKEEAGSKTAEISDFALADYGPLKTPVRVDMPFCQYAQGTTVFYQPSRFTGMHNASEDRFVKEEGQSTVFRYDALASNQCFGGTILCDDEDLLKSIIEPLLTPKDFSIGRSRSAGYGRISIDDMTVSAECFEYEPDTDADVIVLTFLSDAILRDVQGQFTTDVSKAIGLTGLAQDAYVSPDICGGFNQKWGMPLPQVPVVSAGSVVVYPNEPGVKSRLESLAKTGIGDRRNEGFGRLAVNWHTQSRVIQDIPLPSISVPTSVSLTGVDRDLASRMVERLYRSVLDARLTERTAGNSLDLQKETAPENSQLSRLRVIARRAWRENNSALFSEYLKGLKATARGQLTRARLANQSMSFYDWLRDGWEEKIWAAHFTLAQSQKPRIGDIVAEETPQIKREYTVRLIDALCNKAIKERTPKEDR